MLVSRLLFDNNGTNLQQTSRISFCFYKSINTNDFPILNDNLSSYFIILTFFNKICSKHYEEIMTKI